MRNDRFITGGALDFMVMFQDWKHSDGIRRDKIALDLPARCTYREVAMATGKSEKAIRSLLARIGVKPVGYRNVTGKRIVVLDSSPILAYFRVEYHGEGYTVKEVSRMLGCSPVTVGKFCRQGRIKHEKHGRLITIDREDAERFVREYKHVHHHEAV